jgi:nucleotide-binding universal stress UspA family protein
MDRGRRALFAVHGYEPRAWARDVLTSSPPSSTDVVGVLVVVDVPTPPLTSLTPGAGHRYRAAVAEWRRQEEARTRPTLETLLAGLPRRPEVVHAIARRSDPGRTIADLASEWSADVVIVGRDTRSPVSRARLGAIHERVVRLARCAVLVAPGDPVAQVLRWRRRARLRALPVLERGV